MAIPATLSSVPSTTPYIQYVATSGQTVFDYPFPITQDSDLIVVANGVTLATDSGYTTANVGTSTGGSITFTSGRTAGDIITLYRDIPIERITQIAQNSGFNSTAFNAEFNNIYLLLQQLSRDIDQCLQIPNTNNPAPTVTLDPTSYANKYLSFDANGNPSPAVLTVDGTITQATIAGLLFPRTAAEVTAGIVPTNYAYEVPRPERYGAKGDGTTDDTLALTNCLAANNAIALSMGTTYLTSGLSISTTGAAIWGVGGSESRSVIKLSDGSGNVALHFVDSAGNSTHFDTGFIGRDFAIMCASGSSKMKGIYCDNAELQHLSNVIVDLSANTYAGSSVGDGTIALYGYFQQDGVFLKSTFTGGSGAYGDGVYLTGSISGNATPNDNLFLGCRAQSCGGFGVRLTCGDGNKWVGGKFQGNAQGGWSDHTDGSGGGPTNSMILNSAFESNQGDDIYINTSSGMRCIRNEFESTGATNHIHSPNYCTLAVFDDNQSTSGLPVTFSGNTGTGNHWARTNRGFGTKTLAGFTEKYITQVTFSGTGPSAIDMSATDYYELTCTSGTAFSIPNPTNVSAGQTLTFEIVNSTGGSIGTITWGNAFKLVGGSWTSPSNTYRRTITFTYNGQWVEQNRSSGDI